MRLQFIIYSFPLLIQNLCNPYISNYNIPTPPGISSRPWYYDGSKPTERGSIIFLLPDAKQIRPATFCAPQPTIQRLSVAFSLALW